MASLCVGNLHPAVNEYILLEKFSSIGQVFSIHVCRNKRTGESLRYAFVNFYQQADAERALELLSCDILLGQPMRIMWYPGGSFLRKSNEGSIVIKNLEESIDSVALYDVFSTFGKVLSCKVVCDENGSKGYGYVHFESPDAAEAAIKRLNGMLFNDLKVTITHFKSHQEDNVAQDPAVNIHQSVTPSGNVVDAIPQVQNPTSIQQVKPHPSTHKTAQDVQFQGFQNMPGVTDPAVMRKVAVKGEKQKTAVRDAVPTAG